MFLGRGLPSRALGKFVLGFFLFCAVAFLLGTTAAAATTPPGTVISNTARIRFSFPSGTTKTVLSNSVDTVVQESETSPPRVGFTNVEPPITVNTGGTVVVTVGASDTSGIDTVVLDLSPLGGPDTVPLYDDGTNGDTLAGDSIWNVLLSFDSNISGDTYEVTLTVIDKSGTSTIVTITIGIVDATPTFTEVISFGHENADSVRVTGNAFSLVAEPSDSFARVYFEYRPAPGGDWTPVVPAVWSGGNPDTVGPPWSVLWDVRNVPNGEYVVRAVGVKANGETDPSPKIQRIFKNPTNPVVEEWNDTVAMAHYRRHLFFKQVPDTSWMWDGTYVYARDESVLSQDTVWVQSVLFFSAPSEAPAPDPSSGLIIPGAGTYRRFFREDGLRLFDHEVVISLPYDDANLTIPEENLGIYYYDTGLGAWIREASSTVDPNQNLVTAVLRHFTDFAVFGNQPASNLASVLIYPNPYIPYDGDPQTGRPFVKGDNTTGIVFKNVPNNVDITIYTVAGHRVARIQVTNSGGNVQWDVHNDDGREVASGVYFALIRSENGEQVMRKFMVIR